MTLRPQCRGCPWRNMDVMRAEFAAVVEHAEQNGDGFVCHERCGPCDGPYHAKVAVGA